MTEIPFKDLPLYSHDYDENYPPVATAFKDAIAAVDAVLFVTPEYNRSIPGGLKNAIDWASRPYGTNAFTRKPSAVIGTSPGKIGTAVAQQHLRSILAFCNSPQMNAIEAYIQFEEGMAKATLGAESQQPTNTNRNGCEDGNLAQCVERPEVDEDDVDDVAPVTEARSELGKILLQSRRRVGRRHR